MKIGHRTDVGRVRENNEDSLIIDKVINLFIVADGMGGYRGGEVASKIATKTIRSFIRKELNNNRISKIPQMIKMAIREANQKIVKTASTSLLHSKMGSTIVMALQHKKKFYIANIGDSRAYLIRNGNIKQLSEDHSIVGELLRNGEITIKEAKTHPKRNIITKVLGRPGVISPLIKSMVLRKGDCLLLCSDGLTDSLQDDEITDMVLLNKIPQVICNKLVELAIQRGGTDNITVIVIQNNE